MNWEMVGVVSGLIALAVGGLVYVVRLEGKLGVVDERFKTVDAKFSAVDAKHLALTEWLARIEMKLDRLFERSN